MRNSRKPRIREVPNSDSPRNTYETHNNRDSPLGPVDAARFDSERTTSNENDHNLEPDNENNDADKVRVTVNTLEDIEFVVETSVVEDVEDLHPYESVEDDGVKLELLVWVGEVVAENGTTGEVEDKDGGELVDILASDLFPHSCGDERLVPALGRAVQDLFRRRVGGKSERRKRVHDEIDPEQLHSLENGLHVVTVDCSDES